MDDNKNFNELLLEILKQIHVRLDRLDAKIDTKADKEDINALRISTEKDINEIKADLSTVKDDVNSLAHRLDRIEAGISTLRWVIGAQVAIIGVLLAIFKAF